MMRLQILTDGKLSNVKHLNNIVNKYCKSVYAINCQDQTFHGSALHASL